MRLLDFSLTTGLVFKNETVYLMNRHKALGLYNIHSMLIRNLITNTISVLNSLSLYTGRGTHVSKSESFSLVAFLSVLTKFDGMIVELL